MRLKELPKYRKKKIYRRLIINIDQHNSIKITFARREKTQDSYGKNVKLYMSHAAILQNNNKTVFMILKIIYVDLSNMRNLSFYFVMFLHYVDWHDEQKV